MTHFKATISALSLAALLSACAAPPMGPTVLVMPAPGKSTEVFNKEQAECKSFASNETAGMAKQANNQAVGAAVLTTALGAAAGAAGGGGGNGAAYGAAAGATAGAGIGADSTANAQLTIQQQYDNAYSQCMYTKGNQVPGFAPAAPPPPPMAVVPTVHYDRNLVAQIQGELGRLGYLHSTPDGAFGPHTRTAILQFESARGLPQDGIPTVGLLQALQQN